MAMCVCLLCRETKPTRLSLFSEEGLRQDVAAIISKHFWLRLSREQGAAQEVCVACWEVVWSFHQLYLRVARAHNYLDVKRGFVTADAEDDPLPQEALLKSEEVNSAGKLVEALGDNFFDSEVKVEVHDLDLLPQIEIIEETANVSDRAQRASRRGRPPKDETAKRIKRETSPPLGTPNDDDSETELPLSMLMNVSCKTDTDVDAFPLPAPNGEGVDVTDIVIAPQKKRRGRPRKVKEELVDKPNVIAAFETAEQIQEEFIAEVKSEAGGDDADYGDHFISGGGDSGTEDSSDSSSDSSNSDASWSAAVPKERFAFIPKRVVVKPKKYRKREKPLVPPKRMTREEIDAKNAQQAEYDRVILKFFGKFACPKCDLLVQNFSEMRQHFRASHNEDPGYMMCCGRKFHQRKVLAEHVYVHWNPEQFKCATCSKLFQDSRTLEIHEQAHINPPEPKEKKMFQCDKCPRSFTTKAAFEYHSFSKHVPKSEFKFPCPECNKKLPTERKLKDHVKYTHDPESAIICDKCGKKMRSQSNLKKHHLIEHSDVPRPAPVPMQCEICGTWLRHISGLKQHMKTIHEDAGGEHRCHICDKTSTNARALKRHIYHNHECERKFKCTMCEKAFKRPQDLREHTSVHTGEVLYTCPNCPMTFFSSANMYKHRQRLHRSEYEADRKKPVPPNIMQQAVGATAATKIQQAMGSTSAFFAHKASSKALGQASS